MSHRYTRRELEIADHLWDCVARIAEEQGADAQHVLNQAIYDHARRLNFLTPAAAAAPQPVKKERAEKGDKGEKAPANGAQAPRETPPQRRVPPPKATTTAAESLFIVYGNSEVAVEKDAFVIGRSRNSDLVIPSSKVSRQHASVVKQGGEFFIEDLGSPNGVWKGGQKITRERIVDGDEYLISDEPVRFAFKGAGRR